MERIFVQIPSYRDPELQFTLSDLFSKAEDPDRIRVGLCLQRIPEIDSQCFYDISRSGQVSCMQVDARESRGVCWARSMLQQLWEGEEYSLQIDSHMRFVPGWDRKMIAMLKKCGSTKKVLTTYPPHYAPPATLYGNEITIIHPSHFDEWGILLFESGYIPLDAAPDLPIGGMFCGACFMFAPSRIINEIPYDPDLYFFGEEVSLSARLWTHGWDVYHPNDLLLYHCWSRDHRPVHWGDNSGAKELDRVSRERVKLLLGSGQGNSSMATELGRFGLGSERSLADFEKVSGVDFLMKTIDPRMDVRHYRRDEEPLPPFYW